MDTLTNYVDAYILAGAYALQAPTEERLDDSVVRLKRVLSQNYNNSFQGIISERATFLKYALATTTMVGAISKLEENLNSSIKIAEDFLAEDDLDPRAYH